jgi:tRNA pseudouridine55 synthase
LRRVAVGALSIVDAVALDQLAEMPESDRATWLLAPDTLLQSLPAVSIEELAGQRFVHGNPVSTAALAGRCRVYAGERLLGLGEVDTAGNLRPRRVLNVR